jgi:hypothetical protein
MWTDRSDRSDLPADLDEAEQEGQQERQRQLFDLLPSGAVIDQTALEYGVDKDNHVRLPGKTVLVCLLHALFTEPIITLRMLEDISFQIIGRRIDHSSFGKRLAQIEPAFFRAIFDHLYLQIAQVAEKAGRAADTGVGARSVSCGGDDGGDDLRAVGLTKPLLESLRIRILDATITSLSAKLLHMGILMHHGRRKDKDRDKSAYRQVKALFDLSDEGLPCLLHVCKEQKENSDAVALGRTMLAHTEPGDLWIFDKGCHDRQVLLGLHRAGSFFLTPHGTQKLRVLRTLWTCCPCPTGTTTMPAVATSLSPPPPATPPPVAAALRPPPAPDEADYHLLEAYEAIFENSVPNPAWRQMPLLIVRGERYDRRSRTWRLLELMTNLPSRTAQTSDLYVCDDGDGDGDGDADALVVTGEATYDVYDFEEIASLYRRRWEIETFFKFLKGHLGYGHLVNRSQNGIEVMILVQLIASLLLIAYRRHCRPDLSSWRSARFWLRDDVEKWTRTALTDVLEAAAATSSGHWRRLRQQGQPARPSPGMYAAGPPGGNRHLQDRYAI